MSATQTTHELKGHHGNSDHHKGCESGESHHHKHHGRIKTVLVVVKYVGRTKWVERVLDETPLSLIKENAMRHFELDLTQIDRYVLQFAGADQKDDREVGCYEVDELDLDLSLKEEPTKG